MAKRDSGTKRTNARTTTKASKRKPAAAAARGGTTGRSGGMVDAPGKKHRKPLPSHPDANIADSQAAKMRTAMPMAKTKPAPRARLAASVESATESRTLLELQRPELPLSCPVSARSVQWSEPWDVTS